MRGGAARADGRLTLYPFTIEDASRGAMAAGKPPEPENKHAKRTATKRVKDTRRNPQAMPKGNE